MLRVCGGTTAGTSSATANPDTQGPAGGTVSFFSVDNRKKQVTLFDPAACGGSAAPEDRRVGVAAPKMFAFDAIFTQDVSQVRNSPFKYQVLRHDVHVSKLNGLNIALYKNVCDRMWHLLGFKVNYKFKYLEGLFPQTSVRWG